MQATPADLDGLPPRRDPIDTATLTGLVDLVAPDPATITLRAITHGLAQTNRWNGATMLPLNTAQHSKLVWSIFCRLFPAHRAQAIHAAMHDFHEYLLSDITSPLERLVDAAFPGFSAWLGNRKNQVDIAIRAALGVPEPDMQVRAMVHDADMVAADLEWRMLVPPANGPSPFAYHAARFAPVPIRAIKPLPPALADDELRELMARELEERRWAP